MAFYYTDCPQIEESPAFWTSEDQDQFLSECEPDCDDGWVRVPPIGWIKNGR